MARYLAASTVCLLAAPASGFAPQAARPHVHKSIHSARISGLAARSPATVDAEEVEPVSTSRGRSRRASSAPAVAVATASFLAAAVLAGAAGTAIADFDEGGADEVYSFSPALVDDYEAKIKSSLVTLRGATTKSGVLDSMGSMAEAVGINNLDGEMNVFSPSFRRSVATDLADIKSSAPPGLWAGDDVANFYGFLKRQFDPYHVLELKGYLSVAPFLGAAAYLGLIYVQRNMAENFTPAYLGAAAVVFGPIAAIYFLV